VLVMCLLSLALQADYQAGLDAYNAGDYSTAMAEWKEVAGAQPEQETLAIYRESLYAIAMLYWQGDPDALHNLEILRRQGLIE
jgi:hypothetical protein